ncbi:hypothetical protein FRC08_007390 [Ceratobasidium sp. 394]|nr:hypothetical protein FRC08_007390 [Ceratobasidium sp. 394]
MFHFWLSHLTFCCESLENLVFRIAPIGGDPVGPMKLNPKYFKDLLGRFVALRTFVVERAWDSPPLPQGFQFTVPELRRIDWWKALCPSLNSVSLFGEVAT